MSEHLGNIEARAEERRKQFAIEKGLSPDATWEQITAHSSEADRKKLALQKGLPEDATWEQITALFSEEFQEEFERAQKSPDAYEEKRAA